MALFEAHFRVEGFSVRSSDCRHHQYLVCSTTNQTTTLPISNRTTRPGRWLP
jgi:hypothetical protein